MADNIVIPIPEPEPEPGGYQTVIVNVVPPEPEPEPEPVPAEPVIDHAERITALEARIAALEEQGERIAMLEAEQDAVLEMLEEEWDEPEEAVVVEPVADVPPIPEAPPEPVKPNSSRRGSWDYFAQRREG